MATTDQYAEEYKVIAPNAWRQLIRDFLEQGPPAYGARERQEELIKLVDATDPLTHYSFYVEAADLIEFCGGAGEITRREAIATCTAADPAVDCASAFDGSTAVGCPANCILTAAVVSIVGLSDAEAKSTCCESSCASTPSAWCSSRPG